MKYDPNEAIACWPEGEYSATLKSAEEKQSKQGNDMIELVFTAYRGSDSITLRDWAVKPKTLYRLKRLAQALGCEAEFAKGDSAWIQKHIGEGLRLALSVESSIQYGDQNRIESYLPKSGDQQTPLGPIKNPSVPDDDSIPF